VPLQGGAGVIVFRFDHANADRYYRRVEELLSDLRPFWPLVVPIVTGWWREQFDTEGGFAGRPWAALSPAYAEWKAQKYPGKTILQATGDLRQAASRPSRTSTPRSLTLSIDDPKLEYHQDGTGRMPARPLVFGDPLPPAAALEIEAAAERYVGDFLRRF
jgi:hypothetical protein